MKARRPRNILVDFPPTHQHQRQIIRGVSQFCRENPHFRLRTAATVTSFFKDASAVDGVIAFIEDEKDVERYALPVVNVSANRLPLPVPTVASNSRLIGRLAAEHLLRQGYQSFGCSMDSRSFYSRERMAGFTEAVHAAGRRTDHFDSNAVGTDGPASAYVRTCTWLRSQIKPFGLLAHNDLRAVALIEVCRDIQLNVPNDVGIVGVDNDELLTQITEPSLTSVDPGTPLIGYRAADLLARLIEGESVPRETVFLPPGDVIVRESSQSLQLMDPHLKTALTVIRDHAASTLSVDDLLARLPMSRRSLERLFVASLGISPAEEIRRVRINRAKQLILGGTHSLAEVAADCGYSAFRNFATAFRREVGQTPDEYRQALRPAFAVLTPQPPANGTGGSPGRSTRGRR